MAFSKTTSFAKFAHVIRSTAYVTFFYLSTLLICNPKETSILRAKNRIVYNKDLEKSRELARKNRYAEALQIIEGLIKKAPHSAQLNYLYGRILLSKPLQNRSSEALQIKSREKRIALRHLRLAAKQDPSSAVIRFYLGFAWYFNRQPDQAFLSFKKAAELNDKLIDAYYNMAVILEEKKEQSKAKSYFDLYLRRQKTLNEYRDAFDDF